jgi:polynucleotide 5'-kinase involved in rRNA processing
VVKGQLTTADSSPDNESTATPAEQPEARPEQTEGGGKPDEALMVAAERWGVSRVESKHPESAEFLRYTLREIDQRHFSTTGLAARSPRVNANVLVIGPKAIGKSSFVMKALADRFESNGDQLDLDQYTILHHLTHAFRYADSVGVLIGAGLVPARASCSP